MVRDRGRDHELEEERGAGGGAVLGAGHQRELGVVGGRRRPCRSSPKADRTERAVEVEPAQALAHRQAGADVDAAGRSARDVRPAGQLDDRSGHQRRRGLGALQQAVLHPERHALGVPTRVVGRPRPGRAVRAAGADEVTVAGRGEAVAVDGTDRALEPLDEAVQDPAPW